MKIDYEADLLRKDKQQFSIKDQDDSQLIGQTHYYKWLKSENKGDIHSLNTKKYYLKSQGFDITKNYLTSTDLKRLRYIEEHYFRHEILTQLNK